MQALFTGRYPIRIATQSNVIFWDTPWGVRSQRDLLVREPERSWLQIGSFWQMVRL